MKNKELEQGLIKWFNEHKTRNKDFWNRNPIAKTIKSNLNKWDNFKKQRKGWVDF